MFTKVKTNLVLAVAGLLGVGAWLSHVLIAQIGPNVSNEILALVIGTIFGGAVAITSSAFAEAPAPHVPASTVDKLLDKLS